MVSVEWMVILLQRVERAGMTWLCFGVGILGLSSSCSPRMAARKQSTRNQNIAWSSWAGIGGKYSL